MSENGHGDPYAGRRSFDLLTDREAIPRRPSTDNLLVRPLNLHLDRTMAKATDSLCLTQTLASAKLSKIALSDDNGEPLTPSPATPIGNGFPHSGELSSGQSTPSINTPDNTASVITTAQLVKRSDGTSGGRQQEAESPLFSRTIAPVLVRSDSLRASPHQPLPSPHPLPWKKRGKVPDSGLGSDASMSSAWLEIEDALGL